MGESLISAMGLCQARRPRSHGAGRPARGKPAIPSLSASGGRQIAEEPHDSRPGFVAVREDGHMLAALDSEEFSPGHPCRKRFTVLRERDQAILRAMHDQYRDCYLFQRVRSRPRCSDIVFRSEQSR